MLSYLIAIIIRNIRIYYRPRLRDLLEASEIPATLVVSCHDVDSKSPHTPLYVIVPETIEEIQEAVRCARKSKTKISVHSKEFYDLRGKYEGLVIDLSHFLDIDCHKETDTVTVGAGARFGTLDIAMHKRGRRCLPHGGYPSKLVTGHALLGGFGYLSRMWGLTVDSIISLKVILADASIVTASATENPDLFWALCGAGPSFGIVVEMDINTYPIPAEIIMYSYEYQFPQLTAWKMTQALMSVRRFVESRPVAALGIGVEVTRGGVFVLRGVYFGCMEGFYMEVRQLLVELDSIYQPAAKRFMKEVDWIEYLYALPEGRRVPMYMKIGDTGKEDCDLFSKRLFESMDNPLTVANIFSMFVWLTEVADNTPNRWCVVIELYGGQNSAIAIQILGDYKVAILSFLDRMAGSLTRGSGVRSNFVAELADEMDYGDAGEMLREIKNSVDPEDLFCNTFE